MSEFKKASDTYVDDLLSVLPDNAEQKNVLRYLVENTKNTVSVSDIAKQSQVDEEVGIQALTDLLERKQITIDDSGEVKITQEGRITVFPGQKS